MTTESKTELIDNSLKSTALDKAGKDLEISAEHETLPLSSFYNDALDDNLINNVITCGIHFIALIGFANVGKSTFVASLYHKVMCEGVLSDYDFIDSDTFTGFERRAHVRNAKLKSSNRNIRTSQQEGHLLSLEFVNKEGLHRKLVISDRSGETYQTNYVNSVNSVKSDKSLINCKHLIFFIDAETLIDEGEYLDFEDNFDTLLRQLTSANVITNNKQFDIIFNKYDKVDSDVKKREFEKKSKDIVDLIERYCQTKIDKKFIITSNRMNDNEPLNKVFRYIVDCCFIRKQIVNKRVDWVKDLLNHH